MRIPIDPAELASHADGVRSLARALVADVHLAEDVVQDACLAALKSPPREGTPPRAWFVRVVRNLAARARRDEARRSRREFAAARPESVPSASHVAAEIETLRGIVDAVAALDEPLRSAVVLRFFDGLTPHEIAARLRVPDPTARTWIFRGLAKLRERLDDDHGGDGRAWSAALLPLAAGRAGATKSALVQGGIAVTAKTKVSLALAAIVLLALTTSIAFFVTRGGTSAPATAGPSSETATAGKPHRREKDAGAAKPSDADVAPLPRGTGSIFGSVRFADGGKPAVGQKVVLETAGSASVDVAADELGRFRFERVAEVRAWRVRVAADGFAAVVVPNIRLDRDETRDLGVLRIEAPAKFDVVVKDWGDHAVVGAVVDVHAQGAVGLMYDTWSMSAPFRDAWEPVATALTDAGGRATFSTMPAGRWLVVARAAGYVPMQSYGAPTHDGITLRLDRGLRMDGRVVDKSGRPVAGETVWAAVGDRIAGAKTFPRATTDAVGKFVLDGVSPGDVTLLVGRGRATPAETVTVRVPTGLPVEIVLDGHVVEGRVTAAAGGAPIAGARVLANMLAKGGNWVVEATTGEDGRYRLDTIRAGDVWFFRVERQGYAAKCESGKVPEGSLVIEGGHATRDFVLGRGVTVSGRVIGPDGPIAGARIDANWVEARNLLKVETFTDADGQFACEHVAATTVFVQAWSPGLVQEGLPIYAAQSFWAGQKPARWVYEVPAAGLRDVEITLSPETPPAAPPSLPTVRVAGRATTAAGAVADGASVIVVIPPAGDSRWDVETMAARVPVKGDGSYEATFTPRGSKFRVRAEAPGFAAPDSPLLAFAPSRTSFDVDLVLAPLLALEGRVVSSDDPTKPAAGARLSLLAATWKYDQSDRRALPVAGVTDADGRFRIDGVKPGDAKLDVACDGFVHSVVPIVATSEPLTVQVEPSREIAGIVKLPDGTPLPKMGLSLHHEHDNRIESFWFTTSGDDGKFQVTGLPSGTYEITSHAGSGSTMSLRYTTMTGVPAGTTDVEVVVEKAGEISGRVIGPDGRPLPGIGISGWSETGDRFTPSATSGDDGTFVLRGLGTGTYRVDARPKESGGYNRALYPGAAVLAARFTRVAPGTRGLEIRMPAGAVIRGALANASGAPLPDTWVRADLLPGQKIDPWLGDDSRPVGARTDADGRFVLVGLVPARYRLIQVPDPASERTLRPLRGGEDVTAGASDVRLVAGGVEKIMGVVVDETGSPAAEAGVSARPMGGGPGVYSRALADGTFTIDGVSDLVKYVVSAAKGEVLKGDVENVASGATGVRVRLTSGLEASGRVLQRDGTPFAKAYVELALEGGDFRIGAATDAEGRFSAKGLRPGVYRVEESLSEIRPGDRGPRPCGTIRAGDHDVELRMTE